MRRFCLQNAESILGDTKKDLPQRTGPFHYVSVILTPQWLPARLIMTSLNERVRLSFKSISFYEVVIHLNGFICGKRFCPVLVATFQPAVLIAIRRFP